MYKVHLLRLCLPWLYALQVLVKGRTLDDEQLAALDDGQFDLDQVGPYLVPLTTPAAPDTTYYRTRLRTGARRRAALWRTTDY